MDCILCGEKLENPELLQNHIKTHCYDKQYGIKPDPLVAALAALTIRVNKLEKIIDSRTIERIVEADDAYQQRVQRSAETAKRALK